MNEAAEWDKWLVDEDSVRALAPEGYDDFVAETHIKALRERLTSALAAYEVRGGNSSIYQDSSGMAEYRVTAKGDSGIPAGTLLGLIVLSHFGDLVTIEACHIPELLTKICSVLENIGLKYIPYDYMADKTYNGKCAALVGFSWANRYFSLFTDFHHELMLDQYE